MEEIIGGLAAGLNSYLDLLKGNKTAFASYKWVGWSGITNVKDVLKEKLKKDEKILPVFLKKALVECFYI